MELHLDAPKAGMFKDIVELIGQFADDITVCCSPAGMFIQGMDAAHVVLYQIELAAGWFDRYECGTTITVGVMRKSLCGVLGCRGKTQGLDADVDDGGRKLGVAFSGDDGFARSFVLQGYDFNWERMDIPFSDHDCDVVLPSRELLDMSTQLASFGSDVEVECDDDGLTLTSDGSDVRMMVALPVDSLIEYDVAEDGVKCTLVANYVAGAAGFAKLARYAMVPNEARVHFNGERPAEFLFELGALNTRARIVVCPRIADGDDDDGGD